MKLSNNLKGSIILFIAALLWGTTFIFQRLAASLIGPFTFVFFRSIIAVILLYIVSVITNSKIKVESGMKKNKVIMFACLAGFSLFLASVLQQLGLETIEASKSGFITSMYMILVPIISIFFKEKIKGYIFIFAFIALIGSYLLSATQGFSFGYGEIVSFIGAIFFAFQIIFIDKSCKYINPFKLCFIQASVVSFFSFFMMVLIEKPNINDIMDAMLYILYAGILSSSVAYTFQVIGQKYASASIASIVMSLESVIALIFGVLVLSEEMSDREIVGSILIFISVICSQLPFETYFKKEII